jgi:hypothetical protein
MLRTTLLLIALLGQAAVAAPTAVAAGDTGSAPPSVVAYYLHREMRCVSCLLVEDMARFAIESRYGEQLADGRLAFQLVNIEAPGQEHYEQDFELEFLSLVLAEYDGDRLVRWRNLERIWDLYETPSAFDEYLHNEIDTFLASAMQE